MNILFFASIKENLDCEEVVWEEVDKPLTVQEILNKLHLKGEAWQRALDENRILVAINQEMAKLDTLVEPGDEVAFFPPVTGG